MRKQEKTSIMLLIFCSIAITANTEISCRAGSIEWSNIILMAMLVSACSVGIALQAKYVAETYPS